MDPAEFRRAQHGAEGEVPLQDRLRLRVRQRRFRGRAWRRPWRPPTGTAFPRDARTARRRTGKLRGRGIATYIEATAAGRLRALRPGARHLGDGRHASRCAPPRTTTARATRPRSRRSSPACSASRWTKVRLRTSEPDIDLVGQSDGRLAHAARPGQRDALRRAGDREERPGPRGRGAGERAGRHRVRARGPTGSRAPTARSRIDGAREEVPGQARPRLQGAPEGALDLPERLPHRRGGDRARDGRDARSCPTSPATTSATSSTTRSCDGQMQGGVTQGAGHIFHEQAIYDAAGAAAHRQLHGLRHAARRTGRRPARHRSSRADGDQPARREGRGRGRASPARCPA